MKYITLILFIAFALSCSKQEKTSNQNAGSVKTGGSTPTENVKQTSQTTSQLKDSVLLQKQTDEEIISEATNRVFTKKSGQTDELDDGLLTTYEAQAIDLNTDGQKEVFIQLLDGAWPKGFYTLYMKKDGKWYKDFECMGSYSVRSVTTNGYLDLTLNAAVGNDNGRAHWNGKRYVDERGKKPCDF